MTATGSCRLSNTIDVTDAAEWKEFSPGAAYHCEVHVSSLPGGRFSGVAAKLTAAVGEGLTIRDALAAVRDSLSKLICEQKGRTGRIQWDAKARVPIAGEQVRHVIVELN